MSMKRYTFLVSPDPFYWWWAITIMECPSYRYKFFSLFFSDPIVCSLLLKNKRVKIYIRVSQSFKRYILIELDCRFIYHAWPWWFYQKNNQSGRIHKKHLSDSEWWHHVVKDRCYLFICALWSPAGKGLTSWLEFVVSDCEFVTFPLVSWVRCGT